MVMADCSAFGAAFSCDCAASMRPVKPLNSTIQERPNRTLALNKVCSLRLLVCASADHQIFRSPDHPIFHKLFYFLVNFCGTPPPYATFVANKDQSAVIIYLTD